MLEVIGGCMGLVICGWFLGRIEERKQLEKHLREAYDTGYHDGKWSRNKADLEYMCGER